MAQIAEPMLTALRRSGSTYGTLLTRWNYSYEQTLKFWSKIFRLGNNVPILPIEWVRFNGPTITAFNAISILAKAPHPNAARLFIDFSLSKEGQGIIQKFNRVPARPDVPPDPPSLVEGLNLYPARPEEFLANYQETVAQFMEIFKVP
jgi:ABC-type glycerol-3-phosphate transport system substrate-binding protein